MNHLTYVKYLIIFTFFCGAIYVCSVLGQTIRLDMNEMIAAKEAGKNKLIWWYGGDDNMFSKIETDVDGLFFKYLRHVE